MADLGKTLNELFELNEDEKFYKDYFEVSASSGQLKGSTGAVLVGGQVLVGRSKGVERPPLAPLIPTTKGVSLLIDCGANVDARPSHLVQFAKMGSRFTKDFSLLIDMGY